MQECGDIVTIPDVPDEYPTKAESVNCLNCAERRAPHEGKPWRRLTKSAGSDTDTSICIVVPKADSASSLRTKPSKETL